MWSTPEDLVSNCSKIDLKVLMLLVLVNYRRITPHRSIALMVDHESLATQGFVALIPNECMICNTLNSHRITASATSSCVSLPVLRYLSVLPVVLQGVCGQERQEQEDQQRRQ